MSSISDLLVDAVVVIEFDPEVLIDASFSNDVMILQVDMDYLK